MTALLRAQLVALRAQVDAMLIALDGETPPAAPIDPAACPRCGASADQQVDASTLGAPNQTRCRVCGEDTPR